MSRRQRKTNLGKTPVRPGYSKDYYKDGGQWKRDDSRLMLTGAVVLLLSMLFMLACAVCFLSIGRLEVPWPPALESAVAMPLHLALQEVNDSSGLAENSSVATAERPDSHSGANSPAAFAAGAVYNELATVVFDDGQDLEHGAVNSAHLTAIDHSGGANREPRNSEEGAGLPTAVKQAAR